MKRFGFGLLTAGMIAVASLIATSMPASARGGGMIFLPPMGGGMGGGIGGGGWGGGWHGGGGGIGGGWGGGYHGRPVGGWQGNPHGSWNGRWNGNPNWWRNGRWYGPRYRYRYPGYNWYYGGYWYPWPWWSNVWNFQIGENYGYGYYGGAGYYGGSKTSRHVAWCQGRYRSYNPRTDTYTGYDGLQHRCNAPY